MHAAHQHAATSSSNVVAACLIWILYTLVACVRVHSSALMTRLHSTLRQLVFVAYKWHLAFDLNHSNVVRSRLLLAQVYGDSFTQHLLCFSGHQNYGARCVQHQFLNAVGLQSGRNTARTFADLKHNRMALESVCPVVVHSRWHESGRFDTAAFGVHCFSFL